MAALIPSQSAVKPPTKLQLALALAITKRKPPDTDIKEYILQIRQCIKRDKESGKLVATAKFLDSVSFWQRAYEHAEAGQSKLREEIHELKQLNEAFLTKLKAQGALNDDKSLANKRKASAVGKNVSGTNEARKRTKLPQKTIPLADEDGSDDSKDESLCLNAQLCALQNSLQRKPTSHSAANSLVTQAVILCKATEQNLIQTVMNKAALDEQKSSQSKQRTPDIDVVIKGTTIAFHLSHKALHKLAGTSNGTQHQGQVIYYLVGLFESTMTALTLHCTAMSKGNTPTTKPKLKNSTASATNSTQQSKDIKLKPSPTHTDTASRLADLLCTMALSLDLQNIKDQEVMAGFLFLILTRMGRMLALHVFHDLRLPMGVCPGMTFPEGLEKMTDEALKPNEAQIEATYLARLLERMLDSESRQSTSEKSAARQFVANAKDRLQKTLLRAVFGPDESLFREGFRRPQTPPALVLDGEEIEQKVFADWLTQELWRIVGWDVLKSVFVPT
ncbi:uncharacterized protein N7515_009451 [Penicillium bovifimosum]|uniref:Uncharacterized protein n=1 Tax=Penicillium bovifimosum TaxID=126998 RepID=A0A9W9KW08_9EURO|nr:uncharacterized protein N7515_009451 [Penicillium bovifimosum]KAJ5121490.1 hypothetical protein N7515_009451 [Penicillium bovifimosum]